jgi:hypothetical protein
MRPFETADVVLIETLKARHAGMKAQFAAARRAEDAQHAAEIAAELEKADKAFAGRRSARGAGGQAHQAVAAVACGLNPCVLTIARGVVRHSIRTYRGPRRRH